LTTNAFDGDGIVMDGLDVVVQRSYDTTNWTTLPGVPVNNVWMGSYQATITPDSTARVWYRFTAVDDWYDYVMPSGEITITPHAGEPSWTTPVLGTTGTSSLQTGYKESVTMLARLTNATGQPLDGAGVSLNSSANGGPYLPVIGASIENLYGGYYRVTVSADTVTRFQFASIKVGYDEASSSPYAVVTPKCLLGKPSVPSKIRSGKPYTIKATLWPAHTARSRSSAVAFVYTYSKNKWIRKSTHVLSISNRDTHSSTYWVADKLPAGKYKVQVYVPADATHAATTSSSTQFTVRR
jgi:hypothetical protein